MAQKSAWITWETQRRSLELAKALGCDLHLFEHSGSLRYPLCIFDTIKVFINKKYDIIFVQNPSMVLAALACLYKMVFRKLVIVDRHSTFRMIKVKGGNLSYIIYKILNNFTIKLADITIVTNQYLADLVTNLGGKPFVLPDKIPDFSKVTPKKLNGKFSILFICSYALDEPIEEVFEALTEIQNTDVALYVTGNYKKLDEKILNKAPGNVIFTGYLSDKDYIEMLHSVNAVLVLTKSDFTMLCGCYEAVSACKPIITSNKKVLIEYFKGSVFVENKGDKIRCGILEMMNNYQEYSEKCSEKKSEISLKWKLDFQKFTDQISQL